MKLSLFKNICLSLVLITLTGCAATGPAYVQPTPLESTESNMARVFFYRLDTFTGSAWSTTFSIDKTEAMKIRAGGYSYMLVNPGIHKMHLSCLGDLGLSITTDFKAGEDYFFRYVLNGSGLPEEAIIATSNDTQTQYLVSNGGSGWTNSSTMQIYLQFLQVKNEYALKELESGNYKFSPPLLPTYNE